VSNGTCPGFSAELSRHRPGALAVAVGDRQPLDPGEPNQRARVEGADPADADYSEVETVRRHRGKRLP
jgi:hypothetical protein